MFSAVGQMVRSNHHGGAGTDIVAAAERTSFAVSLLQVRIVRRHSTHQQTHRAVQVEFISRPWCFACIAWVGCLTAYSEASGASVW